MVPLKPGLLPLGENYATMLARSTMVMSRSTSCAIKYNPIPTKHGGINRHQQYFLYSRDKILNFTDLLATNTHHACSSLASTLA